MTGKDNEKSYSFLGTLFGKFNYQHSKKSTLSATDKKVEVFQSLLILLKIILYQIKLKSGMKGLAAVVVESLTQLQF